MKKEIKVIIIENEIKWMKAIETTLLEYRSDITIDHFYDLMSAADALRARNWDIIIADLAFDENDENPEVGLIIPEIASNKNIPVIIVSGHSDADLVRNSFKNYKIFDYFFKASFNKSDFIRAFENALNESLLLHNNYIRIENESISIIDAKHSKVISNIDLDIAKKNHYRVINIKKVINNLPKSIKDEIESYVMENLEELENMYNFLASTKYQREIILDRLLRILNDIDNNPIINRYIEMSKNNTIKKSISLEIGIAITSHIIKADQYTDNNLFRKEIYGRFPLEIFDTYSNLSELYHSIRKKCVKIKKEKIKILVIEDNKQWINLMEEILVKENFIVTTVKDYVSAIEILEKGDDYNLIILDLQLDVQNIMSKNYEGLKLLSEIKHSNKNTKTFIITGHPSEYIDYIEKLKLKSDYFIAKQNFDKSRFIELVKKAVLY